MKKLVYLHEILPNKNDSNVTIGRFNWLKKQDDQKCTLIISLRKSVSSDWKNIHSLLSLCERDCIHNFVDGKEGSAAIVVNFENPVVFH